MEAFKSRFEDLYHDSSPDARVYLNWSIARAIGGLRGRVRAGA